MGRLRRGLIGVDVGGRAWIRSRRGTDLTGAFPDIAEAASRQLPTNTLLDGELVVWDGDRLDFTALQRRVASPVRARALARTAPASYVVFDVLQLDGRDLAGQPLRIRRRRLEGLLPGLVPPLQVNPATRDRAVAQQWLGDHRAAGVGIEGLVIKGLAVRYQPGRRAWLKLRTRASAEALVGAVTGPLTRPERLILALPDGEGRLVIAGSTGPLSPGQQRDIGGLLRAPVGGHPWPDQIPTGWIGGWSGPSRLAVTLVEPDLVVEVDADAAYEHRRWRHLTRLIRARPDLSPQDLTG
jgi:ATP-dependent DNA ligase